MWREIDISKIPRKFDFPCKVLMYGCSWHISYQQYYRFPPESRLQICLRINSEKPEMTERINGIEHTIKIPHVAVKMPYTEYIYNMPYQRDAIHFFYSGKTCELLKEMGLLPSAPHHPLKVTAEFLSLVYEFIETLDHTWEAGMADRIDLLCFRILEEIMLQPKENVATGEIHYEKIRQIASCLRFARREEINIQDIAKKYGFSQRSFFRHWNHYMNKTPAEYVREIRLEDSKNMLLRTSRSVADIANELHFGDENYFRRIFKKHTGMTPLQFRKNNQHYIEDECFKETKNKNRE